MQILSNDNLCYSHFYYEKNLINLSFITYLLILSILLFSIFIKYKQFYLYFFIN